MLIYATSADYTGLYPEAVVPANVDALLRFASRLVRRDTAAAIYDTLTDGSPSDPAIATAFTDATCAQVAAWEAAGIDPFSNGLQKTGSLISGKSLDGKTISYDNGLTSSVAAFTERKSMIDNLVPEAVIILQDALWGVARPFLRG